MLAFYYTFTNNFNGKSFTIGINDDGQLVCDVGKGILLQLSPTFEIAIRNEEQVKAGQHGIFDFFSFYGKRNITFSGLILATDHADLITIQRKMQEVLSLPAQPVTDVNDGYITLTWVDEDNIQWKTQAKIQQDLIFARPLGQQLQSSFFISLKAKDPAWLSAEQYQEVGLLGWRQQQFILPTFLPNNFNFVFNNTIDVYQNGNTDAPAIYRLHGPTTNPKVTRLDETSSQETTLSDFTESGWIGGEPDLVHFQTSNEARKLTSVNNVQDTMRLTGTFDLDFSEDYITQTTLSSMDTDTGWSTVGDATDLQVDFSVKKEGNASLKFDIDVSISGSNSAGLENTTLLSIDMAGFQDLTTECWVFIPDVTDITGIKMTLGSSGGTNGKEGTATTVLGGGAFVNGWNQMQLTLESMTPFGTGLDLSAIDMSKVEFEYNGGQVDMSDCRIDFVTVSGNIKRQFVSFFLFIDDVNNMEIGDFLTGENYIKFIETDGVDEFAVEFDLGNNSLRDGWNYFRILKDNFEVIGTPSWEDITIIEFSIKSVTGTTLNITFDDLDVKNITFDTSNKLELNTSLSAGQFVDFDVINGTILRNDGTDLSGFLTLDSQWFFVKTRQNSFIFEDSVTIPPVSWVFPTVRWDLFWNDALL